MDPFGDSDGLRTIVMGMLFLFLPALFLGFAIAFLQFSEAVLLTELSTLELIELYVIELVLFGIAIYVLYWLAGKLKPEAN
jgi:type IV secretory pathway TrbL component